MKILFLCGSLEPGRDGVGDYTRRLAAEIIRQRHNASIIALNDRHCDTIIRTEQESDETLIPVLRIPDGLSDKERYHMAGDYIQSFNPEWLSLQYVPYSFQKKGLPFGLGKRLAIIGQERKWHIMFHELWIRIDKGAPSKHRIIGTPQKRLTKQRKDVDNLVFIDFVSLHKGASVEEFSI
ncbi:hypothetical protein FACS1894182_11320 [Bacteroidia bacterium]|nr:hypothetical protein FACS1894182_11320 [Bacteroidia bacterium]